MGGRWIIRACPSDEQELSGSLAARNDKHGGTGVTGSQMDKVVVIREPSDWMIVSSTVQSACTPGVERSVSLMPSRQGAVMSQPSLAVAAASADVRLGSQIDVDSPLSPTAAATARLGWLITAPCLDGIRDT